MNKIAVALGCADNSVCLDELHRLAPNIGAAEIRLDMMGSFDVSTLIEQSPVELIFTFRPVREGGYFSGSEDERLRELHNAVQFGAAYIDVESDTIDKVSKWDFGNTKLIVSKHWWNEMPDNLVDVYKSLHDSADVVKLVGTAASLDDVVPVFELLGAADGPVIALAMGEAGLLTRVLSPAFAHCIFTYAGAHTGTGTAPGQVSVESMIALGVDAFAPHTPVKINTGADNWNASLDNGALVIDVPGACTQRLRTALPSHWTVR